MNMTGLIHWCEGRIRCPLLSSCQSGCCLSHSLAPRCHQLARAQVSLRHPRCCLPPSVTSLIISLRLVRYLTHRDEAEHTVRTHIHDTWFQLWQHTSENTLVESGHCDKNTHYKHCPHVYVHKRLHTHACFDAVVLSVLEHLLFR